MHGLSIEQAKYCQYFAKGMTAKGAALKAGYAESTADVQAHKWVQPTRAKSKHKKMYDYCEVLRHRALVALDVTSDGIVSEYANIANTDLSQFIKVTEYIPRNDDVELDDWGEPLEPVNGPKLIRVELTKPWSELTKNQRLCIKTTKVDKQGHLIVELYSRLDALAKLAAYAGIDINKEEDDTPKAPKIDEGATEREVFDGYQEFIKNS